MGREAQTKTIGEHEYTIQPFSATMAYRLLLRLGKLLGAPVALIAVAEGGKKGSNADGEEMDLDTLAKGIEMLTRNADVNVVEEITKDLLGGCTVRYEGKSKTVLEVFDVLYQGSLGEMFKVLGAVLEVNYEIPLDVFANFAGGAASALGSAPSQPSE